jgi:hypothetical protein
MSEPGSVPPPPPPASPFNPNAVRPDAVPPQPQGRSGCGKPLIIGCISLLALAAIGAVILFVVVGRNPGGMLKWSLDRMEQGLMAQMAPEVTAEEKQRLSAAFDSVGQAIDQKRVDPQELQSINFKILELSRKGPLGSDDVKQLSEELETLASGGPAPPAE